MTPPENFNGTFALTVEAVAKEGNGSSATTSGTVVVTVEGVNDAPTLDDAKTPVLSSVAEDAGGPSGAVGTLVSGLVDFASLDGGLDNVGDVDGVSGAPGLALVGTNEAHGTWYYTTDGGGSWQAVGSVSDDDALLLVADADTRLYFQPAPDFNGTIADAITFRAWDRSTGSAGAYADTTANGGTTAFSTATDTAAITVNSVNDVPTVNATDVLTSSTVFDNGRIAPQTVQLSNLGISGDTDVTVEFWLDATPGAFMMPFGFQLYDLLVGDLGSGKLSLGFNTGAGDLWGVTPADLGGNWHHVAAIFHAGNVQQSRLFLDGVEQTLTQLAGAPNNSAATISNNPRIGGWNADAHFGLDGRMDDVRVWHGARNAADILSDLNQHGGGAQANLAGEYLFESVADGAGGVLDSSGSAHDGTLVNQTVASNVVVESRIWVREDTQTRLTGISIADADADGASPFIVHLSIPAGGGTLSASGGGGVSVLVNETGTLVTLTGTLDAINAYLASASGVSYTPAANANADVTLTVTANDQGATGPDGAKTGSANFTLDLIPVNDSPSLSASAPSATLVEAGFSGAGTATAYRDLTKSDPDTGDVPLFDSTGWTTVAPPSGAVQWTEASGGNGHWYKYVPGNVTWTAARTAALGQDRYLANVTSGPENAFIQNSVKGAGTVAWLGGSDAGHEATWTWTDGPEAGQTFSIGNAVQPGFFAAWWGSEPNNVGGSENYVYIDGNGVWTDVVVNSPNPTGYIIEFQPIYRKTLTYGSVELDLGTGRLTYTLDNNDPDTQALKATDHVTDELDVTVKDAAGAPATVHVVFNVDGANDSPVLNAGATPVLAAVNEDAGAPSGAVGTLVSALVDLNPPAGGLDNVTESTRAGSPASRSPAPSRRTARGGTASTAGRTGRRSGRSRTPRPCSCRPARGSTSSPTRTSTARSRTRSPSRPGTRAPARPATRSIRPQTAPSRPRPTPRTSRSRP